MLNEYMYEKSVTRVVDVYGRRYWVATRHLKMENKTMIHLCNRAGLLRTYTKAGNDGQNAIHRANIAEVLNEYTFTASGEMENS